jgi:putative acetyltransferase
VTVELEIREERPEDVAAIHDVNTRAFGQEQEGDIVDAVRVNGAALISLVAVIHGRVVGHVMYSPLLVGSLTGAALGPISVLPEHQRHGIGSKLIESGNQILNETRCPFIVVLGHPNFYPRFGFKPASVHGITCEWAVPDDVFMVLVLDQARMSGVTGVAKYRHEFSSAAEPRK